MKHHFYKIKFPLLMALTLGFAVQAHADRFQISDIQVEGLQRVSASPVFAALPLSAGDFADPEAIRATIRDLFATGFFDSIEVLRDQNVLIIQVRERPTISAITIEGNKAIKTEMLEEAMAGNDLAEGQIFQRATLDGILNELERQYIAQGRYAAEVSAEIVELPNNQVRIEVLVDEGSVARIKHINIVGNQVFGDDELGGLFELNTTGFWSWLTSNDRYAREKLQGDLERLESYYLDRGYLDFNIVSTQVSLSPDQKSIYITVNISEGEVYTVDKIELAGELIVPEPHLRRMVMLHEGETFSQARMTATSEYITTLLGNAGYTNAEVRGIPERNREDKTVTVTFLVNPSHRVYVRRIDFKGNTRTQDEVLRREMRQMESSPASNARIDQGKVRLERLGFFRGVNVNKTPVAGTNDLVDVEYTVEEQPSASINASLGYGAGTGMQLGASLQHNNWQGSGKQVSASVNRNIWQTSYQFSYLDPYFTPDGVSRGFNIYYNKRDFSRINVTSYSTDTYGVDLRFGYPISEIQRLNFSVGYSFLSVTAGARAAQEIRRTPFELDLENSPQRYVTYSDYTDMARFRPSNIEDYAIPTGQVEPDMLVSTPPGFVDENGTDFHSVNLRSTWLRSTLNRGMMATRGSRQSLTLDVTVPQSDLQYYTLQYDGQIFAPLGRDFTMRFRTSLGFGDGYGDMERLPFFKNFYSGGFGSVRGFERSALGPMASNPFVYEQVPNTLFTAADSNGDGVNDAYLSGGGPAYVLCEETGFQRSGARCVAGELMRNPVGMTTRSRSFGGNLLVEFGADLIFPLPFIDDQRSFQTSLFVDVGNVFDTRCSATQINCSNFDVDELRASVGIGVDWISPMGPLTFSLARPIRYQAGDERQHFQFSVAAPF